MGYDVTFHPVSAQELQKFVFDVVDSPALAESRAAELTQNPARLKFLRTLYGGLSQVASDPHELPTVGLACGMIAGFLHPYWYARGQALSFVPSDLVPETKRLFTPLPKIAKGKLAKLAGYQEDARIDGNESGSGFIDPGKLNRIEAILQAVGSNASRRAAGLFDQEGLESLRSAVSYAQSHGLGLLEASEVVTPIADVCHSNYDNLRAHFIGRLEP